MYPMRATVVLFTAVAAACSPSDRTEDPGDADVTGLFVATGPDEADTVIVFAQGGPFSDLRTDRLDALPGAAGKLHVYVHQPWTLDSTLLGDPDVVSYARALELDSLAADHLDRVARYFVGTGRTVFVVGHSYGALLALTWLVNTDLAVPVRMLAGRLAMPEEVWTNFRDGRLYWFPDGREPRALPETPPERIVPMRLQAGVGAPRYLELLRGRDLSNLLVVYGRQDRLVGALDTTEVMFLRRHGARVLALEGGHRSMFEAQFTASLRDSLFGAP